MASYALGRVRTAETGNPITFSYTVGFGDKVIGLLLKVDGAADRTGGAPTLGPHTLLQANTTQKAAASPEASAEAWYVVNPQQGTHTFTIPNSGGLTIRSTVVIGRANAGLRFAVASGGNATGTNPTPGTVPFGSGMFNAGGIGFAIVASGAQTWAPSAQAGTIIANTDDGATGGGEQYTVTVPGAGATLSWTFGTSDDYGAVSMYFAENPGNALQNYMRQKAGSGVSVGGIG